MLDLVPSALAQLTARLHQLHWLPTDVTLTSAATAGDGNMNRTLRVHTDGSPATLILKQSVPFVAKYPDIPAPIERASAEAAFYAAIAGYQNVRDRTPTLIGYDGDNYLLAFEDLGAGSDQLELYQQTTPTAEIAGMTEPLIEWLSALHAIPTPELSALPNRAMRELNHTHIFRLPLAQEPAIELAGLSEIASEFATDRPLVERALELGAIYLGETAFRSDPVLLHGDFYPGGWLTDSHNNLRVIDAEFCFIGPAEFDLGVTLAHLVFAGTSWQEANQACSHYQAPPNFEPQLCEGFAGMEIIRRLLGVAQLPLVASTAQKIDWLSQARELVVGARS